MVVTEVMEATPSFITVLPITVLTISVTKVTTVATATPITVSRKSLITVFLMVHLSLTVVSATLDTKLCHMVTTTMVEYKFFLTALKVLTAMVASATVATEVTEVTATVDTKSYLTVKPSELMAIRSPSRSIFMYTTIINITEEQNVREFKMKN